MAKLTVSVNNNPPNTWPVYVAEASGLFRQNGLDVDIEVTGGGPAQTAALLSGQVQVIQAGGIEAVGAAVSGADVVIVGVLVPVLTWTFMVPPSFSGAADLKGQKVGVPTLGGTGDSAARIGLPKVGLDPVKDVTIVGIGNVPALRTALLSGAVVGGPVPPLDRIALEQQGFRVLFDLAALHIPAPDNATVVNRSYAAAQRTALQKYVDSLVQSAVRMKQDRALAIDALKKPMKSDDDETLNKLYDYYVQQVFPSLPFPKPEQFTEALTLLAQSNDKVRGYDVSKVLDLSFVQSAADRGLARA